jgi:ABC-type nickel/cobalt efflux system permease component RcnA
VIAANPGPAMHMAVLGIVIVIGLIAFAIVRFRNRREAAEAEKLNQTAVGSEHHRHEHHERPGSGHHQR